jgi:hypothetical protein
LVISVSKSVRILRAQRVGRVPEGEGHCERMSRHWCAHTVECGGESRECRCRHVRKVAAEGLVRAGKARFHQSARSIVLLLPIRVASAPIDRPLVTYFQRQDDAPVFNQCKFCSARIPVGRFVCDECKARHCMDCRKRLTEPRVLRCSACWTLRKTRHCGKCGTVLNEKRIRLCKGCKNQSD